jgi:hypothetical protein
LERASAKRHLCRIQAGSHRGERVITLSRIFQLRFQRPFCHKPTFQRGRTPRSAEMTDSQGTPQMNQLLQWGRAYTRKSEILGRFSRIHFPPRCSCPSLLPPYPVLTVRPGSADVPLDSGTVACGSEQNWSDYRRHRIAPVVSVQFQLARFSLFVFWFHGKYESRFDSQCQPLF